MEMALNRHVRNWLMMSVMIELMTSTIELLTSTEMMTSTLTMLTVGRRETAKARLRDFRKLEANSRSSRRHQLSTSLSRPTLRLRRCFDCFQTCCLVGEVL